MRHRAGVPGARPLARVRAVAVTFAVAGMAGSAGVAAAQGTTRVLGVQVAAGTAPDPAGAQVAGVVAGSMAQRIGVRPGDRLLRIGQVELASRPTDPPNASSPANRVRAAVERAPDIVPVVVERQGQLLTGLVSWREDFVPVPLHDGDALVGAFMMLGQPAMVPVDGFGGAQAPGQGMVPAQGTGLVPVSGGAGGTPTFGNTPVPASGGSGTVPATGGSGRVPSFGDASVPSFGRVPVPSTGGTGRVPASGGTGTVPSTGGVGAVPVGGERPVLRPEEERGGGDRGRQPGNQPPDPDRAWRAACASLPGTRLNATYQWLSRSGAAQEQLRFHPDGSYALLRSSAVSSYAEDGCYAIRGGELTFYKALSSAMGAVPSATSAGRVTLGSASSASFEPRTVRFALEGNGQGGVVIDGERYWVQR